MKVCIFNSDKMNILDILTIYNSPWRMYGSNSLFGDTIVKWDNKFHKLINYPKDFW